MLQRINATAFFLSSVVVFAGPPTGYYDLAEGLTGAALKQALHEIIDDHIVISYSRTDEFMRVIDEDPQNSANVGLIYSNFSMSKGALGSSGASVWNREHLWPRSYGIDSSGPDNSDMHNLYPCNASVNSSRSNKYYDETTLPSTVNTVSPENTFDSNSWEPADSDKGIVARAVLYMAARYEGDESADEGGNFRFQSSIVVSFPINCAVEFGESLNSRSEVADSSPSYRTAM